MSNEVALDPALEQGALSPGVDGDAIADLAGTAQCASAPSSADPPIFAGDEDNFVLCTAFSELASEATTIEALAKDLDRSGDPEQAISCYKQAAERLSKAASLCPEGHGERALLSQRAGQVLGRVVYLESLSGAAASVPPQEHIPGDCWREAARGAGGASSLTGDGSSSSSSGPPSWKQQAASAAAVGGAAGILVLHAPIAAAALAAGAAYATTRKDGAGDAARTVGNAGLTAAAKAKEIAEENRLQERLSAAAGRVQELDAQYSVSERAQAAASATWTRVQDFDQQHQVTAKVGKGLLKATTTAVSATSALAGWAASTRQRGAGGGGGPPQ